MWRSRPVRLAGACFASALWVAAGCQGKPPQPTGARRDDANLQDASLQDANLIGGAPPNPPQPQPQPQPGDQVAAPGRGRNVSVSELIALLKNRKELRTLTPQNLASRFVGLISRFDEIARDDTTWEFEGSNAAGFISAVIVVFRPAADNVWTLRSVSARLHPDDPRRTFEDIRRRATAALKKPKWLDLSTRDRTAWNLGDHWELTAAVLDDGDIQLRAGPSAGP
jgi:hypothetical protein